MSAASAHPFLLYPCALTDRTVPCRVCSHCVQRRDVERLYMVLMLTGAASSVRRLRIYDFGSGLVNYSQSLAVQDRLARAVRQGAEDAVLLLQVRQAWS